MAPEVWFDMANSFREVPAVRNFGLKEVSRILLTARWASALSADRRRPSRSGHSNAVEAPESKSRSVSRSQYHNAVACGSLTAQDSSSYPSHTLPRSGTDLFF